MHKFFEPRSVVLIGVSRKSGPGAYNNLEMMLKYGYRGRIFVAHPKVSEILGHATVPDVTALPETPDLAVISVGRERVLPIFAECAQKGIKRVIVISQGFADADEQGKELQKQLQKMAKESGIRVVGPNTMGVVNAFNGFSTAFVDIPRDPAPPPLAMVVQSGVFQVGYESFSDRLGKAIDIGNGCDLDFTDVLEYLENDAESKVIVLHMEGMVRGREFLKVAARVARRKPIIVFKTGRSTAGAQAALSHTGSLVGEDAIFDMAFAKAGLIRVHNMIELRAVARAFLHFRPLQGPRLAVITATGACGIMTADACEDYGLTLAPCPETIKALENPHIAWHLLHNPVDIWPLGMVGGSFTEVFKRAARILLQDANVDAILGIAPALVSPVHKDIDMIAAVNEIKDANNAHKPIALWLYGGDQLKQCESLGNSPDVACFATIDEAVMGLAASHRYYISKQREADEGAPSEAASKRLKLPSEALLVGEDAFELLRHYHIPVVPGEIAKSPEDAVSIAEKIGYPVVLKIISPQWLHKSDRGGIRLDIKNGSKLHAAYAELKQLFDSHTPEGILEGVLIQRYTTGTELLMGIKRDPQFGSILVVGMGGIYTEVFKDVARTLAPLERSEAYRMLQSLRLYPILKGIRGQQGVDLEKLVETLLALSQLAIDYPAIAELDLNPVVAFADGCWCVDCRIVVD